MSARYNPRSASVKRILQEMKELHSHDDADMSAGALEDNIFEWHFVVRGPLDTEFEGGLYHGRIQLPAEYPFKPPAFQLCTPNGRFEVGTKVCLSISQHHPELWQPSWGVRTALTALIAFLPTPGKGALGSLDYPAGERRALAAASRRGPPAFGCPQRQKLAAELHQRLLDAAAREQQQQQQQQAAAASAPPAAEGSAGGEAAEEGAAAQEAPAAAVEGLSQPASTSVATPVHSTAEATPGPAAGPSSVESASERLLASSSRGSSIAAAAPATGAAVASSSAEGPSAAPPLRAGPPATAQRSSAAGSAVAAATAAVAAARATLAELEEGEGRDDEDAAGCRGARRDEAGLELGRQGSSRASLVQELQQPVTVLGSWEDAGLTGLAGLLLVGIAALLLRRLLVVAGLDLASPL